MTSRNWSNELRDEISEQAQGVLGFEAQLEHLAERKGIEDQTEKWFLVDSSGRRTAIAICSPQVAPGAVRDALVLADEARSTLGDSLGGVILRPLYIGHVRGVSFSILPYCHGVDGRGLSQKLVRLSVRGAVLRWLRAVTVRTARAADDPAAFLNALAALEGCADLDSGVRQHALTAARDLEQERWTPVHVLMHGDMWIGNVMMRDPMSVLKLFSGGGWRDLVIIDWGGAQIDGYAMFDLVRFLRTVRIGARRLRRELFSHCRALGCDVSTARAHLLCALGSIRMNLGCFPIDRFVQMANGCCEVLDILNGTSQAGEMHA